MNDVRMSNNFLSESSLGTWMKLSFFFRYFISITLFLTFFSIKFSYRPGISCKFVKETLAFEDDQKCLDWLTSLGVVFLSTDKENIDCKTSMAILASS
jgi:hypothetical protein